MKNGQLPKPLATSEPTVIPPERSGRILNAAKKATLAAMDASGDDCIPALVLAAVLLARMANTPEETLLAQVHLLWTNIDEDPDLRLFIEEARLIAAEKDFTDA